METKNNRHSALRFSNIAPSKSEHIVSRIMNVFHFEAITLLVGVQVLSKLKMDPFLLQDLSTKHVNYLRKNMKKIKSPLRKRIARKLVTKV